MQAPTDLAILTKIASMLRSGKIGGTTFKKVVGVGHSASASTFSISSVADSESAGYGSVQLQALTSKQPDYLDAVVLTGFTTNKSAHPSSSTLPKSSLTLTSRSTAMAAFTTGSAFSIATQVFPNRFPNGSLPNTYLVSGLPQTNQLGFFYFVRPFFPLRP